MTDMEGAKGLRKAGVRNIHSQRSRDRNIDTINANWKTDDFHTLFPPEIKPDKVLGDTAISHLKAISKFIDSAQAIRRLLRECTDEEGRTSPISFQRIKVVRDRLEEKAQIRAKKAKRQEKKAYQTVEQGQSRIKDGRNSSSTRASEIMAPPDLEQKDNNGTNKEIEEAIGQNSKTLTLPRFSSIPTNGGDKGLIPDEQHSSRRSPMRSSSMIPSHHKKKSMHDKQTRSDMAANDAGDEHMSYKYDLPPPSSPRYTSMVSKSSGDGKLVDKRQPSTLLPTAKRPALISGTTDSPNHTFATSSTAKSKTSAQSSNRMTGSSEASMSSAINFERVTGRSTGVSKPKGIPDQVEGRKRPLAVQSEPDQTGEPTKKKPRMSELPIQTVENGDKESTAKSVRNKSFRPKDDALAKASSSTTSALDQVPSDLVNKDVITSSDAPTDRHDSASKLGKEGSGNAAKAGSSEPSATGSSPASMDIGSQISLFGDVIEPPKDDRKENDRRWKEIENWNLETAVKQLKESEKAQTTQEEDSIVIDHPITRNPGSQKGEDLMPISEQTKGRKGAVRSRKPVDPFIHRKPEKARQPLSTAARPVRTIRPIRDELVPNVNLATLPDTSVTQQSASRGSNPSVQSGSLSSTKVTGQEAQDSYSYSKSEDKLEKLARTSMMMMDAVLATRQVELFTSAENNDKARSLQKPFDDARAHLSGGVNSIFQGKGLEAATGDKADQLQYLFEDTRSKLLQATAEILQGEKSKTNNKSQTTPS
ncbi:hypothetical protein PVAG01_09601 [Phlyctema vagabunda]|uniref:Uncharacterized protein n=1 Tax=Phlyctema vagabunda TaxID=108571 RepID=A0ABR4P7T3_9HELO